MKKKIFFAHSGGAQGSPGQGSYDLVEWLRRSLQNDFEIFCPVIEDPEAPSYDMWKRMLDSEFSSLDGEIILIGHSLGGSMLLKYLSEEQTELQIAGLFLISTPCWGKGGWSVDEFKLRTNFDAQLPEIPTIHLFHSTDDPIVPFEHLEFYKNSFPDASVYEISGDDHVFANGLPKVVEGIKSLERSAT